MMMMIALLFSISTLLLFQMNESFILEWNLVTINSTTLSFPILINGESALFLFTVSFISMNVLLFSKVYMSGDMNLHRFTQMVMLFIGSMMILILCPNTMMMLLGWDGLGITSFLLVIYYQNPRSLKSGFITLATNRIGDCLILFSIAIIMSQGQWSMINMWKESLHYTNLLTILILFAAMTKSAQFPFMAWLTCAMAAPTPVSALVHSSTLVTAGVFLLIRFYTFLSELQYFNMMLLWAGMVTMFMSAAWAMTKKDIKETIALSTMSQLGLMMTTLSLGMINWCFLHLITHAMFKATMFMAAGMIITFKGHRQNFTSMKMKTHSRTSAIAMITSIISMNAMFFMAGYYSKDSILEMVWYSPSLFMWMLFYFLSTMMTATYSTRLWRGAVTSKISLKLFFRKNIPHHTLKTHMMSNNFTMVELPLLLMTLMSMYMGSMAVWFMMTPNDSPMAPPELESFAPLAVLTGSMLAICFCTSSKSKWPTRAFSSISKKQILMKPYKTIKNKMKSNSNMSSQGIFLLSMKYYYTNYKNLMVSLPHTQKMKKLALMKTNNHPTSEFIYTNYKMAKPVMMLSYFVEKMLDVGAYKLLGPTSMSLSTPTLSLLAMKFQASNINMILTVIMVTLMFTLPIIIM
uniref:NADH-ubiquinone oxidoreductase chain 5 n=1 Tax=Syllis sp. JYC-2022 TaxID=2928755 RepID=A0A976RV22_9ANNE|nr:NADH dehydrogenase subunit 5 [Syllis sp. JYC-2022]